jgi:uncharacterized protein (TIGR00369 family)
MSPVETYLPFILEHPLHRAMGVESEQDASGRTLLAVTVNENTANVAGKFHGGIAYAVCDMACYLALLPELQPGENAATLDIHVSMLRAASLGDRVRFSGTLLRRSRNLAFMRAEAHCGELLIAQASVTKTIFRTPGN